MQAQASQGFDAHFQYLLDTDLRREPLKLPSRTVSAALDEFVVSKHAQPTPISLLRSQLSSRRRFDIEKSSLVHLHWIEGALTQKDIFSLAAEGHPLVWTLHDMRPFTGACHHSFDCNGFESDCSQCPQVRSAFRQAVKLDLQKKAALFSSTKGIRIVAPSEWLARQARKSLTFRNNEISVVHNPISDYFFSMVNKDSVRKTLGIGQDEFVGLSIAEQLSAPGKQIGETLETFFETTKSRNIKAKYILIGGEFELFAKRYPDVVALGTLTPKEISELSAAADVYINMSVAESFGLATVEAISREIFPLVRNVGGLAETISKFGYGIACESFADLREALGHTLHSRLPLIQRRKEVAAQTREKYSVTSVSKQYLEIYSELVGN
jgi:glycosyltransferase involved in cell wall biosynthesis